MKVRQEYYTEQVGKESYREVLANDDTLRDAQLKVLWQIVYGPKTLQEVSELTGMKEHLVCARLNELRKNEWVITDGEKKFNPLTNKNNSVWKLNSEKFKPKQLNIF